MDQRDHHEHSSCKVCYSLDQRHMISNDVAKHSKSRPISNAHENSESNRLSFQESISTNNTSCCYGLRENPKKTNRLRDDVVASDELNVCKSCGRGFQSSKALFGHMKCHSEKLITIEEQVISQSDGNEQVDAPLLYSRRRSKRMKSSENEREDVAMSLMMLSKDSWGGSEEVYSDEDVVLATPKGSRTRKQIRLEKIYNAEESLGFDKRADKRNTFQCGTCMKVFHSYQALGGHRASHKKIKGCYASKFDHVSEKSCAHSMTKKTSSNLTIQKMQGVKKGKSKKHECPFCLKIFSSGQALGGHKRSHLLNSSGINSTQSIVIQEPTTIDLLDLNLPAPTEEDTPSQVSNKQWWGCTKPESPKIYI